MPSSRFHRAFSAVLLLMTLLAITGCQTYVNIPEQTGDVASTNVNGSQARAVMGEALRGLSDEMLAKGTFLVLLPSGATPGTYDEVVTTGGDMYTWADRADANAVVDQIEIRAVRIRGLKASVDIIRSSQPGDANAPQQLVTIHLERYIVGGWASRQVRVWRMNVAEALRQSSGSVGMELDQPQPTVESQPAQDEPPQEQPGESQPAM